MNVIPKPLCPKKPRRLDKQLKSINLVWLIYRRMDSNKLSIYVSFKVEPK